MGHEKPQRAADVNQLRQTEPFPHLRQAAKEESAEARAFVFGGRRPRFQFMISHPEAKFASPSTTPFFICFHF